MKKYLAPILLILLPLWGFSQLFENFDDGDFTSNPPWSGNIEDFVVNEEKRLQLNKEGEEAVSTLYTSNAIVDSVSWEFFIKLSFSPSANNNAKVYLIADQVDLNGPLNGYFLQFGESLSSDAIELFKQNGDQITSICRGQEASIASSFELKIKVMHRINGDWIVYSDFDQTGNYVLECSGNDSEIDQGSFFGFVCNYTSSNANKFYFDDIHIKYMEQDLTPPELMSISVLNEQSLRLNFSEALSLSAEDINNYSVNNGLGSPDNAALDETNKTVILTFESIIETDTEYEIEIRNIEDLSGNIMSPVVQSFKRIILETFDVLINEIMADPTPVVGLPDVEYIEIYNATEASIDLSDWVLQLGGSQSIFPQSNIEAGGYRILCKSTNADQMSSFGEVIGFPSFSLTNTGQSISLYSAAGLLLHSIEYTDSWYRDEIKDDGGWSLELINPQDYCSESLNWIASMDNSGGSPGIRNSVYNNIPALPQIKSLEIADNPLLLLRFSQQMNPDDLLQTTNYLLQPDNMPPSQILLYDTATSVYLVFAEPFELQTAYNLIVDGTFRNCAGQLMETPQSFSFYLPKVAEAGDIVINEIMIDPDPPLALPAYEYLELYNNSSSPVVMNNWHLKIGSTDKVIESATIQAGNFLLICSSDAEEAFLPYGETYSFSSFSLNNTAAALVLKDEFGGVIHQLNYTNDWHSSEEKKEGGWSLEAIEPSNYCQEVGNWASSTDGRGGSPGTLNSIDGMANEQPDLSIRSVSVLDENIIKLIFSEKMDSLEMFKTDNFFVDRGIGEPFESMPEGPGYESAVLYFDDTFLRGEIYTLEISGNLRSCSGAEAAGLSISYAQPDQVVKGDVVFNELLFDAAVPEGEFIELVNISEKFIDISDLSISRMLVGIYDTSWYTTQLQGPVMFPGDYYVFTKSPLQVQKVYHCEYPEKLIQQNDFITLPNSETHLLLHLKWNKDSIVDRLIYAEEMHHSLLKDTKGVSLEKININGTNESVNWHSAASNVNYATPTYQNSQFLEERKASSSFELKPEIFSPDNDGYEDLLQISYKMKEAGYILNLVIYDSNGRQVKRLVENEIIATHGQFFWNGEDTNNSKADKGIYILLFEYFDLNGNVYKEKLTTVLGGKL